TWRPGVRPRSGGRRAGAFVRSRARAIERAVIAFSSVTKQYGGQVLFVDASFQINPGEKVGLVGPNGAGKSTVFRMIAGEEQAEEFVRSQVSFDPDAASGLSATIDGISVSDIQGRYFEQSALFEVVLPEDNV